MSRAIALAALVLAVSVGATIEAKAQANDLDAQARAACARMGLNVSEAPFAYCVIGLRQSAGQSAAAMRVQQVRQACYSGGLRPGTPAFSDCVIRRAPNAVPTGGYYNSDPYPSGWYSPSPLGG
jgi:hypothetical protein